MEFPAQDRGFSSLVMDFTSASPLYSKTLWSQRTIVWGKHFMVIRQNQRYLLLVLHLLIAIVWQRGSNERMWFSKLFSNSKDSCDFVWTIKSFSKPSVDDESKWTSKLFESKGYSWKLRLYPNGNIVNGQISLYLMLEKADSHPTEAVFNVSYELFLFCKKPRGTISKKGEYPGQIHDEIGFQNLINLKAFKDSVNGYLVNDRCMFGVKILHIVPILTPIECLCPVEKVRHEYTWIIENFSKMDKKCMHQQKFTAGDYQWSIIFYPDGERMAKGNYASLFLKYEGSIHDRSAMKVSAEFSLSIIDQIEGKHGKLSGVKVFEPSDFFWGIHEFMPLENFHCSTQGFLINDTCNIKAEVAVNALVK